MSRRITVGALVIVLSGATVVVIVLLRERHQTWNAMVPAYFPPEAIEQLVAERAPPRLLVVNPDSGPGTAPVPAVQLAVAAAHKAGTRVLGYVHTGYGARDPKAVTADIERYRRWYRLDGIFFDEASHAAADLGYYRALAASARAAGPALVVLNPGVVPAPGYFRLADVVVTFEGPASAYPAALARTPPWLARVAVRQIAQLVYSASPAQARDITKMAPHAAYVYVTSGDLPNPWRTPSPYRPGSRSERGGS